MKKSLITFIFISFIVPLNAYENQLTKKKAAVFDHLWFHCYSKTKSKEHIDKISSDLFEYLESYNKYFNDKKIILVAQEIINDKRFNCKDKGISYRTQVYQRYFLDKNVPQPYSKTPLNSYSSYVDLYGNKDNITKEHKSVSQNSNNSIHENCLQAKDYKGCMTYQLNPQNNEIDLKNLDCVSKGCTPQEARLYREDNLGLKTIPGYYFQDRPDKRAALYISKPYKLNVNGNYGRYVHVQRINRYFSEGYSGSLTTTPSVSSDSSPIINYSPGKASGIGQTVENHVFDCEDKTYANYYGNRLRRTKTISGKRKKWVDFDDLILEFELELGIKACSKKKDYITSLKESPFTKLRD